MTSIKDYKIATLGSHSALQILKGAKDEGFETICICNKGRRKIYESFNVADEIIDIDKFEDFFTVQDELIKKNVILIPHGSFVTYIGPESVKKIKVMHYGTKGILEWEGVSERRKICYSGIYCWSSDIYSFLLFTCDR
jgi:5-formaminoimidazole-4-carboxamide-1-(beta)-D-ribofuranosyl 5'-monophosphate synthetase